MISERERYVSLEHKGLALTRFLSVMALHRGQAESAAMYAERQFKSTPEVSFLLRSIIEAGDTTTSGWGLQLVGTKVGTELYAFLDSASIFQRLTPTMQQLSFNRPTPVESTNFSASWTSEAGAIAIQKMQLATNTINLEPYDLTVGTVYTSELARFASPGAERTFRDRFIASIAKATDNQFLNPSVIATPANPASVTSGGNSVTSTGSTAALTLANFTSMLAGLTSWNAPRWIVPTSTAAFLSTLMTAGGSIAYPNISATGGSLFGIPVLVSANISGFIVLLDAGAIVYAKDPLDISGSDQAVVEMETTPALGEQSPPTTQSVLKSMWQNDLVMLKAIQRVNWVRGHSGATIYMSINY